MLQKYIKDGCQQKGHIPTTAGRPLLFTIIQY